MKRPASALVLALLNLLLVGIGIVTDRFHVTIPYGLAALPLVLALLLLTLGFALRDLLRKKDRSQVIVALGLTLPIIYIYFEALVSRYPILL